MESSEEKFKLPAGRDTNSNDAKALRCRVFIGNLAVDQTSKREVEEIFSKYGDIKSCSLHNNFGFVQFAEESGADAAVTGMHGTTLFDKRIDVNLAGLRRKTQAKDQFEQPPKKSDVVPADMMKYGERRPHRSRSPLRDDRDEATYGRGRERGGRRRSTSPMSRYEELYRRDDPYQDGRGYSASYGRNYPTDLGGYERRPPPVAGDYYNREDSYARTPYHDHYRSPAYSRSRPSTDCEIVSLSNEESRYAEEVHSRLRSIGLVCNIGYPPSDVPLPQLVDRIAQCGSLYAVVVGPQNAQHRSCTLNVLHGTRQEHRNMPLDDALSFVARNFDSYLRFLRESSYNMPPHVTHTSVYGAAAADRRSYPSTPAYQPPAAATTAFSNSSGNGGGAVERSQSSNQLTTEQITDMIEKLKKEKDQRLQATETRLGRDDTQVTTSTPSDVMGGAIGNGI